MHRKVLFWMVVVVVVVVVSSSGECGNKTTSAPSWGWGWAGAELGNTTKCGIDQNDMAMGKMNFASQFFTT